jgi:16S rRNA (uracil1498-N3)-methyltransferase
MKKIRLFVNEENLSLGKEIKISENDFEYLTKVMRQKINDEIFIFNGVDGEFIAAISQLEKKFLNLKISKKISELKKLPNITLAFALVKNVRIDFFAQKATELGVSAFQPILTQHTIVDKINSDRFKANVKEALEQCERNDFPQIFELKKLVKFLEEKDSANKIFILCDESGQGIKASQKLSEIRQISQDKEIVILIGPEGGFSENEFTQMRKLKNLFSISLGPRILRADTAMISALTLVQEFLGDF